MKNKSGNYGKALKFFSLPIPLPLPAFLFLLCTCFFLFGCSASGPPPAPYTCPTSPGFTLPDYCKTNFGDPLSTTSIGEAWVVPSALYLYTEAPTAKKENDEWSIEPASSAEPKIYQINQKNLDDYCSVPGIPVPVPAVPGGCAGVGGDNAPPPNFETSSFILAQHAAGATSPPLIKLGIFAYDPDGKLGSGLDVSISFLATDSNNVNAGIFENPTNLLPNGAGKKVDWRASSPTNPSQLLPDGTYTLTATGFDDKNFTFAIQFNVKVCQEGSTGC